VTDSLNGNEFAKWKRQSREVTPDPLKASMIPEP